MAAVPGASNARLRAKDEVYLTKYLIDNILEEPINTEDGLDNDFFNTIANVGDIDLFVNEVLLPALVQDEHMDESKKTPVADSSDEDGPAKKKKATDDDPTLVAPHEHRIG